MVHAHWEPWLKQTAPAHFAVSERGYVALLDRRSVEVRRVDALGELLHRFSNIAMAS